MERVFRWLEEFQRANLVRLAFGDPYQRDGRTVIPVGRAAIRLDLPILPDGTAGGELPRLEQAASLRPLALITIGEEGVRVAPVGTRTLAWALAMLAAGAGVFAGWRLSRSRRT